MQLQYATSLKFESPFILAFQEDKIDKKLLKEFIGFSDLDFSGKFKELESFYSTGGQRIYLVGLGKQKDESKSFDAFRKFAFEKKKHFKKEVQLYTKNLTESSIEQAVLGFGLAEYEIGRYKSEKKEAKNIIYTLISDDQKSIQKVAEKAQKTAETINDIKHLVDAPANVKYPEYLAEWTKRSAKTYNYECEVFDEKQLKKDGFEAVLAVGRGSQHPPRVIVTKYFAKKSKAVDVALVGKGITFDTGGISIKGSQNLHYMKSDMGGSAAVLGVVELAAKLKLNINLIGIVGAAENAVDANSYLPGDVIGSYSGKTIEIIDTDAEGRLVLADCLNYAVKKYKPKQIIDLATLTGSAVRALGYSAAAMFSNNAEMKKNLENAGEQTNEKVWPMPLFKEFEEDLHSDIADIRNFSGKPVAGAITAAKFLEAFTEQHKAWLHLDIAGVAFGDNSYAKMKSASGYGVHLLVEYLSKL